MSKIKATILPLQVKRIKISSEQLFVCYQLEELISCQFRRAILTGVHESRKR